MKSSSPFERAARTHIASRESEGTRTLYSNYLARWLVFCELENVDVEAPTLEAAIQFREALKAKYASPTVRTVLSSVCSMYEAAGISNPFKSKRLPRPPADEVSLTRAFSAEEVQALFKAAFGHPRDVMVMSLLHDTGMRVSSVAAMRRSHLHELDGKLYCVLKVKKKGRVEVQIPDDSRIMLLDWLARHNDEWVFPLPRKKGHITRGAIHHMVEHYGKMAGIKDAHPHRFRATFITAALDAGVPLNDVQAAVHHSDPKTTQRYDRGVRGTGVTAAVARYRASRLPEGPVREPAPGRVGDSDNEGVEGEK